MYYFIGNNIGQTITGIEKAQLNRLKLFNDNDFDASCVFVKYNPKLHENVKKFKVSGHIFSIYDYFQNTITYEKKNFDWIQFWTEACHFKVEYLEGKNDVRIYDEKKFIIYAHFSDDSYSKLEYINYFDENRNKIKREIFDTRGFLSHTKYLMDSRDVYLERYFDNKGNTVIEKYYKKENEEIILSHILVTLENGRMVPLNKEEDLLTLFTEEIYKTGDIFFSDKNSQTINGLVNARNDIPVVAVLHSTHLKYQTENKIENIKDTYKSVFSNINRLSAIVTSTYKQKSDVQQLIGEYFPVYNIPVGYVSNSLVMNTHKNNKIKKIISIARNSPEKQLVHQLEIIQRLKQTIPNVQLHLFGQGNQEKLMDIIKSKKIEDNIFLRGFKEDLSDELESSCLFISTSKMEGFSLATLEALSKGVPAISYDIDYGPSELIQDNKNGYLIPLNCKKLMYQRIEDILLDDTKHSRLSHSAVVSTMRYSSRKIFSRWYALLEEL